MDKHKITEESLTTDKNYIIDEILKELYKRLGLYNNLENSLKPNCKYVSSKKKIAVIGRLMAEDQRQLELSYEIAANSESFLIAEMDIPMLVNLAIGTYQSEDESFIMKALLSGKKVYILENGLEYRKYKKTAHSNLYSLYRDYEYKLRNFGIEIIKDIGSLCNHRVKEKDTKVICDLSDSTAPMADLSNRKLLLESDLKKLQRGTKTIVLNQRCIITPLADDYIRDHGIEVVQK